MTFDDIHGLAADARQSRALVLDMANLAPAVADAVGKWLNTTRLQLSRVNVSQLTPDEIRLTAAMQIGLRVDCELRFFRETSGVGYALTFATGNPLDLLRGDFRVVADLIAIDALWWTASSRVLDNVDVAINGLEAKALRFRQGFDNVHLRLDSAVLGALQLAESVFDLVMTGQIPQFSVAKELRFKLDPVLEARVRRLTVGAAGALTLDGDVMPKLLGVEIPAIPANLHFTPTSVAIRVPVPDPPAMPNGIPFQVITLSDCSVEINAALGSVKYGIAADGRYRLPGGSGHGGTYRFEFAAGNTSPIPDMIELDVNELDIGDVLNLISPARIRLPSGLTDLVKLRNGYAYYAVRQGARSASGVVLDQGVTARGSVTVFGAPGYFSVDVHNGAIAAALLTNPLKLGNVIALRGTGVRPPSQYAGPLFAADAIGIAINTGAATATAALIVDFLGQTVSRVEGAIEQGAVAIKTRTSLPFIADVPLDIRAGLHGLSAKGGFEFRQPVDLPFKAGFSLQGLGKFSGTFDVTGDLGGAATVSVQASLSVLGFTVSLPSPLVIDPNRLKDLADLVAKALYDAARKLLLDAVELVKAFLMGAVRYTLAAAEAGRKLVKYLAEEVGATPQRIITIMHDAGATANRALDLVRDGAAALGEFAFDTVVGTMRTLYDAAQTLEALRQWAVQFAGDAVEKIAENLAWLMRKGGFAVQTIMDEAWRYVGQMRDAAKAFARVLMLGGVAASEIAKQLKQLNVGIDAAGRILGEIFGTDILENILRPAFGIEEARRVGRNIEREMGRFSRNVEDEWNSFWGRLGIRW